MNINRSNCEAFFLDYHEGHLTPLQVSELMLFLEQHVDLKQVFESFENISLEEECIVLDSKDILKKRQSSVISCPSFEQLCVADIEGEISFIQKKELNEFIYKNASLNKEYQLYKKTKLVPEAIIFEDKYLLKKNASVILLRTPVYYYAAAASVILLIGLFFVFNSSSENKKTEIASSNKTGFPVVPETEILSKKNNKNNIAHAVEKKNTSAVQNSIIKKNKVFFSEINQKSKIENNTIAPEKQKQEESQLVKYAKHEIKKEADVLLIANNQQSAISNQQYSDEYLSLKEAVVSEIKIKLLADELPEQELKDDNLKKFKLWDVAVLVTKTVRKLTGKDINIVRNYDKNDRVTASTFNIGNFSIEHIAASR